MRFQNILAGVAFATLIFTPQNTFAQDRQTRNQTESGYLVDIDERLNTHKGYGVLEIDAINSTRDKLRHGYRICRDLDSGKSIKDLDSAAIKTAIEYQDGTMASDRLVYFLFVRESAIVNLCPKYKSLINH